MTEQPYVDTLYAKLDTERSAAREGLAKVLARSGGNPQERAERDVAANTYQDRIATLNGVEAGLCFGRLDHTDGSTTYIGRIGLLDEDADYEPLLIDWRAPVARPFYLATAAFPQGVHRRRHLRLRRRTVVGVDDEVLDLDAPDTGHDLGLAGEASLLAALNRQRGEQMRDIVATIQAEQDAIIRSSASGVLVVQGGPGTGKTAVALHRAAYLLYEHREALSARGVLVLGPNATFLRYIGQVLPSLGETGVLLATIGELLPGVRARGSDSRAAAEVKGRAVMAEVLAAAVSHRQRVPQREVHIAAERYSLVLDPDTAAAAREAARESRRPHNLARRTFREHALAALARQAAENLTSPVLEEAPEIAYVDGEQRDTELLGEGDLAEIAAELGEDPAVGAALDDLWPEDTPEHLLGELLTGHGELSAAAAGLLAEADVRAVLRPVGHAWAPGDIPLIDELAELLGEDDTEARAQRATAEREQRAYAQGVLHILEQDDELADEERLRVADILDAELLAEREQSRSQLTAAQRAAADRTWTFGHVIIDEAQELTAMDWRMVMRRCPSRSLTVVGDIAQTGAAGGAASWEQALRPYVADRWRCRELTVNYRTPAEIMRVAAGVLARYAPEVSPPRSVRETGREPWERELGECDPAAAVASMVAAELPDLAGGSIAVLCPRARRQDVAEEVAAALGPQASPDSTGADVAHAGSAHPGSADPDGAGADGADPDGAGTEADPRGGGPNGSRPDSAGRVSVLSVTEAKGLEFDAVVVLAPEEIVAESPRGRADLFVALTRATQRLGIAHPGRALEWLAGAASAGESSG